MKKHTKVYFDYFKIEKCDFVECEKCHSEAIDIHHIDNKGIGGSKTKDYISNLIALCRECHTDAHNEKISKETLRAIHAEKMYL